MADISALTVNDTTYQLKDAAAREAIRVQGTELIYGTQTAATNLWTGVTTDEALYDGKQILYYLPVGGNSTAATLNLTLAGGGTTGAKPVHRNGTWSITTHYSAGSLVRMTWLESKDEWQVDGDFDSTAAHQVRVQQPAYITKTALYRYQLLVTVDETTLLPVNAVNNSLATNKTLTTETFDPFGPIFYYLSTTNKAAGAKLTDSHVLYSQYPTLDLRYSFNVGTTLTANRAVYLVCAPQAAGGVKLHSQPISQTLPTSEDGLVYIYLGQAYSAYQVNLVDNKPVYWYRNGRRRLYTGEEPIA